MWILNAYQTKEEQFVNVRQVLLSASKKIELKETEHFYALYSAVADSLDKPDNVNLSELIYTIHNDDNTETYIFYDGVWKKTIS